MTGWIGQVFAVTGLNLHNLSNRRGSSVVAIAGIAGVVTVFIAVLSIAAGFEAVMTSTGKPDTVLVMRAGSDSEMSSGLDIDTTRVVAEAPGVLKMNGVATASAELYVVVDVPKKSSGTDANVPLRGVQPSAFEIRAPFEIVEGRNFEPGRMEIIAGEAAAGQFEGLTVGSKKRWGENEWTIVGIFSTNGTVADSELWTDVRVLQPAYRRENSFQSVFAKLESPEAFQQFKDALTADVRADVDVYREAEYYAEQSEGMSRLIRVLGTLIAALMGIGATFGALNTMYSAVAARAREIATLRALGFGAGPVVVSVMVEALLLAGLGGLVGGALAYLAFNGYQTATMNWQTFSQVAFGFQVTPDLLRQGTTYALAMGLVGGLFPALRAARLPIATALREL